MSSKKKKILFIYEDLVQAGAQRYMYELINLLDERKFEIHILCGRNSNSARKDWKELYYFMLKNKGFIMHRLMLNSIRNTPFYIQTGLKNFDDLFNKISRFIYERISFTRQYKIKKLLKIVDWITIFDHYTYSYIKKFNLPESKFDIHLMSHYFQDNKMFSPFDKGKKHIFFIFCMKQKQEALKYGNLSSSNTFQFLPLLINLRNRANLYQKLPVDETKVFKIGLFTRLDSNKMIEPFLIALKTIVSQHPSKCKLYIIGNKTRNPNYTEHIKRFITFLSLEKNVKLEGHIDNLESFIFQKNIHVSWHYSAGNTIGYSGIEVASYGIPSSFYSILPPNEKDVNDIHYSPDITSFVNRTMKLLTNHKFHKEEGEYIRKYLFKTYHSEKFREMINLYYSSLYSAE